MRTAVVAKIPVLVYHNYILFLLYWQHAVSLWGWWGLLLLLKFLYLCRSYILFYCTDSVLYHLEIMVTGVVDSCISYSTALTVCCIIWRLWWLVLLIPVYPILLHWQCAVSFGDYGDWCCWFLYILFYCTDSVLYHLEIMVTGAVSYTHLTLPTRRWV